jgi:hypothetical protein
VAQSVVYVLCCFHFCIGFPTNRIFFCVGSKRVCGGSVVVVACRAGQRLLITGLFMAVVSGIARHALCIMCASQGEVMDNIMTQELPFRCGLIGSTRRGHNVLLIVWVRGCKIVFLRPVLSISASSLAKMITPLCYRMHHSFSCKLKKSTRCVFPQSVLHYTPDICKSVYEFAATQHVKRWVCNSSDKECAIEIPHSCEIKERAILSCGPC